MRRKFFKCACGDDACDYKLGVDHLEITTWKSKKCSGVVIPSDKDIVRLRDHLNKLIKAKKMDIKH